MATLSQYTLASGSNSVACVEGPDGNVWVTLQGTNKIARVTPGGTVDEFACPVGVTAPTGICVVGSNIWYAATGAFVKISTFSGTPTQTKYSTLTFTYGCCAGPDGNLWMTAADRNFHKINPADGTVTASYLAVSGSDLRWITSDGTDLYATNRKDATGAVSRCTTGGTITTTACADSGAGPIGITYDPTGGLLYVTAQDLGKVYKVTTGATQTFTGYTVNASSQLAGITVGPDGRVYTAGYNASYKNIYSMPAGGGSFSTEAALSAGAGSFGMCSHSAGAVWICEYVAAQKISKLATIAVAKTATGETASGTDTATGVVSTTSVSASDSAAGTDTAAAAVLRGVVPDSVVLNDQFTDTAGTNLESHTPDSGGTWSRVGGTSGGHVKINSSGRVYADSTVGAVYSNAYEHSATIPDGTLEAEVVIAGSGGDAFLGVRKGSDGGGYTVLWLEIDNGGDGHAGRLTLQKRVGGVLSTLGTPYDVSGWSGTQKVRLYFVGSDVRVYLLIGATWTQVITATVTDLTTGVTGLWFDSPTGAGSASTEGLQINYVTTTVAATTGSDAGVGTDTSGGVIDPSIVAKTASDSAAGTDTASVLRYVSPIDGSPGSAPSWHISRQTIQTSDIQNAPCGGVQCASGKIIAAYNPGTSHASTDARVAIKTAASEAAANAGTWSSATVVTANDGTYYYGAGWLTRVAEGAHANRVFLAYVRANVASGPDTYQTCLKYTDDEAATWSAEIVVPPVFGSNGTYSGDLICAPIIEIPGTGGQEFVIAAYGWDSGQVASSLKVLKSTDGGLNWSLLSTLSAYDASWDQGEANIARVRLANGSYRYVAAYNKIPHGAPDQSGSYVKIRYSDDDCATWSSEGDSGLGVGWGGAPAIHQSPVDLAVYLLLRKTGAGSDTWYSRSVSYGDAGSFTSTVSIDAVGSMRYGQWLELASGRQGLVYGTETTVTNAGVYWRVLALNPATAGSGNDTGTATDAASVQVGVGSIPKTASDGATGTDTASVAKTRYVTGSDAATGADSSGLPTSPEPTITHSTYTVAGTGGKTASASGNQITVAQISDTSPMPA